MQEGMAAQRAPRLGVRRLWRLPSVPALPGTHTLLFVELLAVLAIFPARSTFSAAAALAQELAGSPVANSDLFTFFGSATATSLVSAAYYIVYTIGVPLLVWYLLRRSGGGFATIGLDRHRLVRDLLFAVPLFFVAWRVHLLGVSLPDPALRPPLFAGFVPTVPAVSIVFFVARALSAGVLEEIVVLGFLTTRLRQAGWAVPAVAVVSILVRASYHVEYGPAVLGPVLFGVVATLFYLRTRRLLPVILMHAAVDIVIALGAYHFTWGS